MPPFRWVLTAKTSEEAKWWATLLNKASKSGVPDYAVYALNTTLA